MGILLQKANMFEVHASHAVFPLLLPVLVVELQKNIIHLQSSL